jgi:hypothetical protein
MEGFFDVRPRVELQLEERLFEPVYWMSAVVIEIIFIN